MSKEQEMTVLLVEPEQHPKVVTMKNTLDNLQESVGGHIQAVYHYADQVAFVCNEEGKLNGLPLNRAIYDREGELQDIIAGSFLVVGLTEDDFGSLSPELLKKYEERFQTPEAFMRLGGGIMVIPIMEENEKPKREKPLEKTGKGDMSR